MKLSEYLLKGKIIHKKAKLLIDVKLENGYKRKKGQIVTLLKDNEDGTFHAEDNEWATTLESKEFELIK